MFNYNDDRMFSKNLSIIWKQFIDVQRRLLWAAVKKLNAVKCQMYLRSIIDVLLRLHRDFLASDLWLRPANSHWLEIDLVDQL